MNVEIPKPRSSSELAQRIQEAALRARQRAESQRHELPKGDCWALSCNLNPLHLGILFADGVDPNRELVIHTGMWWSTYKPIEVMWAQGEAGRDNVICDACLTERQERVILRVQPVMPKDRALGFCFTIPVEWRRFLRKVTAAELTAYLGVEEKPAPAAPEPEPKVKAKEKTL